MKISERDICLGIVELIGHRSSAYPSLKPENVFKRFGPIAGQEVLDGAFEVLKFMEGIYIDWADRDIEAMASAVVKQVGYRYPWLDEKSRQRYVGNSPMIGANARCRISS